MKNLILSLACATALTGTLAHAQSTSTSTTTATTAGGQTTTQTTTTESTGTITEWSPGSSMVLSTGSGSPVHYRVGKSVTYVTTDGKVIDASRVRKDAKVRVHYSKEGNDMIVDKVYVLD